MEIVDMALRFAAHYRTAAPDTLFSQKGWRQYRKVQDRRRTQFHGTLLVRAIYAGAGTKLASSGMQLNRATRHFGFKSIVFGILALAAPTVAHAEPSLKEAFADPREPDIRLAINVSGLTLGWVNARLIEEGKPRLFCLPPYKAMTIDEYMTLMGDWIKSHDYIANDGIHSFPRHLIDALVAAYPC